MKITDENDRKSYKDVWILAEINDGEIHSVTYELLGIANELAGASGCEVAAVCLSSHVTKEMTDSLIYGGADKVITVTDEKLAAFNDELECNILQRLVGKYKPEILLGAATNRGRALMPRLAGTLHAGLTADCTELSIDPDNGDLLQTRPAFGGNIMATIRSGEFRPQMATVRPKVMRALTPDNTRRGTVISESAEPSDSAGIKEIIETVKRSEATASLADAKIIVAGGRAMGGPEGFRLLEKLASLIGGAVGASRPAVDSGWIDYAHQIGQTGQTVQADLYISCGISGQIQHLVGMQSAGTIVAIDKDDTTPMMNLADVAVKGDLFEIIPLLIEELENMKKEG
ncbi:MAG: electron transfer flavoprotein subunit alpha/FixB family protein [Clostridia bacterium]|nr:electron transfer flavoprotein subunit alpha/FixB family protein [Clostridia bacterium]